MSEPLITVVIPTYNRAEMLCRCIRSVLNADYPAVEVVVVDDCSKDDTRERVAREFADERRVKYVRNAKNGMSSYSRNHGVQFAHGEYVLFLDDDNEIESDMLRELVAAFARHPKAGMIAPLTVHWYGDQRILWTLGWDYNPWTSRTIESYPPPLTLASIPDGVCDFPSCSSPNAFMLPRMVFDEIGGLDEGYGMQMDDTDIGMRIRDKFHYEVFITSKARTRHFGYLDPNTVPLLRGLGIGFPKRAFSFARNRYKFARRFFPVVPMLFMTVFVAPVYAAYYFYLAAIKCRSLKIGLAYLAGAVAGFLGLYRTVYYHPPYRES